MIGTSFGEWVFIRLSILVLRYPVVVYTIFLGGQHLRYGSKARDHTVTSSIIALIIAEVVFAVCIYWPATRRLSDAAVHPEPLSRNARRALFHKCFDNVPNLESYIQGWFLGAEIADIRRDNLREFILWAFFEHDDIPAGLDDDIDDEVDEYIEVIETRLDYKFALGKGPAKSLRLTIDPIHSTYRGLMWYIIIFWVDALTHLAMRFSGFQYYSRQTQHAVKTFPPRLQELAWKQHESPAARLGYWYSEHTNTKQLPVLFIHGIGVGLLTYIHFLADLRKAQLNSEGNIGIIAIELLPISFRLTQPMPRKDDLVAQISTILKHHNWREFTIASHSYGSVVTSQLLSDHVLQQQVRSVMLVDPVSVMLHLPTIAYNFTRRTPRLANEWQLWYFASTDPVVANCLGRHFFWRENIAWKEELVTSSADNFPVLERKVTACLAGRDIILDPLAAAQYLAQRSGEAPELANGASSEVTVLTFPRLDHAQVFDNAIDYRRIIDGLIDDQEGALRERVAQIE